MSTYDDRLDQMAAGLRSCIASQGVHEFVLVHLVSQFAGLSDRPEEFMKIFVEGVGQTLRDQIQQSGRTGSTMANDTLEYFESLREMLLGNPQADLF